VTRRLKKALWSGEDERAYQADCLRRSPETYRGWWQLKNILGGCDRLDWANPSMDYEELIDPKMPIAEVEQTLQVQTFDAGMGSDLDGIEFHDRTSIEEAIAYLCGEQAAGQGYHGDENVAATVS